jgi:hypothetical protein
MASAIDEQRKSWPAPNYDTPENHDALIIGITVPVLALAIICKYLLMPIIALAQVQHSRL